jgi:hypothetical protein
MEREIRRQLMAQVEFVDPFENQGRKDFVDPFGSGEKKTDQAGPLDWSDVPLQAVKHFLPDAYDTAKGVVGTAVSAAHAAAPYLKYGPFAGAAMAKDIGKTIYDDPSILKKIPKAVYDDLVESYGSEDALKHTIANHPAKIALDVATLIGGGVSVAGRVGRTVSEIGKAADVSRPFFEIPRPPATPPPLPAPEAQTALERLRQAGMPVDVPRAITSDSPAVRAGGQALSVAPIVGTPLREAVQAVPKQVGGHIENIAAQYSPELPENVIGGGIERNLSRAAGQETAEGQAAAEADHAKRVQAWEAENAAREQAITARQAEANNAAERAFGNAAPMEVAQDTINDVQSAARQARTRKDALYSDVNNLDARVHTSAFPALRQRAEQALSDAGISIDDPGSNASTMLRELDRLSGQPGELPPNVPPRMMQALQREYGANVPASVLEQLGFPGGTDAVPSDFRMLGRHAPAPGADAVSVQGLEHLSKRIGRMGMQADTPEDRFASRTIKGAFDDWRNDALGSHLTADSEANAGPVIDAARAAHRDLMERFGYNYRRLPEGEPRNAAKMLNQIVTGGIGPEGLRDNLIGAKPGNRRVSAPLYEAISNAVPNAGEFRNRMRGAYWNAMSEGSPAAIARNVDAFTPTRMGSHLFEPQEHDLMRGYSRLSQDTPAQLRDAARIAKENEPKLIKPEAGKSEQLAGKILGRNRSDEQVFNTVDRMMREGGDIKNFARTWGKMPEANRNELRGAWLRNMGGGGEEFNVSAFVKNWDDYSKQAKSIMLDRPHREAMEDFHTSLKQYADTIKKYGNPSGTAQVTAWHKLASGVLKGGAALAAGGAAALHPIGTAMAGLGLRKVATILAKPEGPRQINRWTRLARAYDKTPSANTLNLLQTATRTLQSTQSQ